MDDKRIFARRTPYAIYYDKIAKYILVDML